MNLKKFKKSLVSIVLGASLFIGNGGVVCHRPKAWLCDEFFKTARERYKDSPGMKLLLSVSEFLSKLSRPSTPETEFLSLKEKLLAEISDLKLNKVAKDFLEPVIEYLETLSTISNKLAELEKALMPIDDACRNQSAEEAFYPDIVGLPLLFSVSQKNIEISAQVKLWTYIEYFYQSNKRLGDVVGLCWTMSWLKFVLIVRPSIN